MHQNTSSSLNNSNRTKIIATVGPSTDSYESIREMLQAGANGIRLNFSHGTHEERSRQIKWIRKAAKELDCQVAIIQDLQGPKIRLGDFEGAISVEAGQVLRLGYKADYAKTGVIPIQYDLSKKVKRGERLYINDGRLKTTVNSVKNGTIYLEASNSASIFQRKGINLPDTSLEGDILTAKDKADLVFGSVNDIDYVAQSFVQSAADVRELRRLMANMNMDAKIIVKFETQAAIDHMEEIITETDALMVARGDLAYETQFEAVPSVQRRLIAMCARHAKPVIVATQMLISMTTSTEPTRAEVSDVANAVFSNVDCLMLSDETASGQNPIEAVKTMASVIAYTETNNNILNLYELIDDHSRSVAIARGIVNLADSIDAKAIVAETKSGATAKQIAAQRSVIPIIAVTGDKRSAQQLSIVHNVLSYVRPEDKMAATKLTDWLTKQRIFSKGDIVVTASGKYPGVVGTTDTIKVRIID